MSWRSLSAKKDLVLDDRAAGQNRASGEGSPAEEARSSGAARKASQPPAAAASTELCGLTPPLTHRLRSLATARRFLQYVHDQYVGLKAAPTPYLVEYTLLADATVPPVEPPADCPGLLFFHWFGDPEPRVLVAYWATREHYDCEGAIFREWVGGIEGQPVRRGFVQRLRFSPKPFWKRGSWYSLVLGGLLTFFGALDALITHYSALLEEPSLSLAANPVKQDLLENTDGRLRLTLTNHTQVVHRNVEILPAQVAGPTAQPPWITSDSRIPEMASEKPLDVNFTGRIGQPGTYQVSFTVKACAGYLRPCQIIPPPPLAQLQVWSRKPRVELNVVTGDGDVGRFAGKLLVPEEVSRGLDCRMEIDGVPGLQYANLSFSFLSGEPALRTTHPSGSTEVAVLTWSSGPVGPFQVIPIEIAFRGRPAGGWQALKERIEPPTCNEQSLEK